VFLQLLVSQFISKGTVKTVISQIWNQVCKIYKETYQFCYSLKKFKTILLQDYWGNMVMEIIENFL
jgi:hypothetical protein